MEFAELDEARWVADLAACASWRATKGREGDELCLHSTIGISGQMGGTNGPISPPRATPPIFVRSPVQLYWRL